MTMTTIRSAFATRMNSIRRLILCGLAGLALACIPRSANAADRTELTLTEDGWPSASIVIARQPTKAAQFAAYELQNHIRMISGAELPIVKDDQKTEGVRILVGESEGTQALGLKNADFKGQEYLVSFRPGLLVLMGRDKQDTGLVKYHEQHDDVFAFSTWPRFFDEQGTMVAVYDFLERSCGVRWLNPTEDGTVCPEQKTLRVVGEDIRSIPSFEYREVGGMAGAEGYEAQYGLWHPESDGYKTLEAAAYPELHRRHASPFEYIHAKRAQVYLFLFRMRAGGTKRHVNHSLGGYLDRFWKKSANEEVGKYFVESKPDWWAQGYGDSEPLQLCYSNPEVVKQVVEDIRTYFKAGGYAHPERNVPGPGPMWGEDCFALAPMDNDSFCKCPRCAKTYRPDDASSGFFTSGIYSEYWYAFVNQVAKEIKKSNPDKYIITTAYASYAFPPRGFKLESNVLVAPCFHIRNGYDRRCTENDWKCLDKWATQDKGRPLYPWLYYTFPVECANNGPKALWHVFPGFFAHTIAREFKRYRDSGVRGMYLCGFGQEVEAYVTFKLMQNVDQDVDVILDDYFKVCYGAAAEPMKRFYLTVEEAFGDPKNYPSNPSDWPGVSVGHQNEQIAWGCLGTEDRMLKLAALMEAARQAAQTPMEKHRVAMFDLSTWSYMVEGRRIFREKEGLGELKSGRVFHASNDPAGDASKVDWREAAIFPCWRSPLNECGGGEFEARALHDGDYLYLRLKDMAAPAKPVEGKGLLDGDYVRVLLAVDNSSTGYSEIIVSPQGHFSARHFADGQKEPKVWESGGVAQSAVSRDGGWNVRLALPLAHILGGIKTGDTIRMNFMRHYAGNANPVIWISTGKDLGTPARFGPIHLDTRAQSVPAEILTAEPMKKNGDAGLVGRWRLGPSRDRLVRDSSGHKLDGQWIGNNPSLRTPFGKTLQYFKEPQYLQVEDQPLLRMTSALTLEAWVKLQTPILERELYAPTIIGKGSMHNPCSYWMGAQAGRLMFRTDDEDGRNRIYAMAQNVSLSYGDWDHVAATFDGTMIRLYVNGREAGTLKLPKPMSLYPSSYPLRIGSSEAFSQFQGLIGEAAVYHRALSPGEIFAHFKAGTDR